MFYNNKMYILGKGEGFVNESGVWVEGVQEVVDEVKCDIQPITKELAFREYGYDGDVKYEIYCPNNKHLKLQNLVKLEDNRLYQITVVVEWDDYTILVVSDKHDSN